MPAPECKAARNFIAIYLSKELDPVVIETKFIGANLHEVREVMGLWLARY